VGKARTFEVSSGDEGFTKGLWLHKLDDVAENEGDARDQDNDIATILLDSEGLRESPSSRVRASPWMKLILRIFYLFYFVGGSRFGFSENEKRIKRAKHPF
jgi:hypothetical protein